MGNLNVPAGISENRDFGATVLSLGGSELAVTAARLISLGLGIGIVALGLRRDREIGFMLTLCASLLIVPLLWELYLLTLIVPLALLAERMRPAVLLLMLASWLPALLTPLMLLGIVALLFLAPAARRGRSRPGSGHRPRARPDPGMTSATGMTRGHGSSGEDRPRDRWLLAGVSLAAIGGLWLALGFMVFPGGEGWGYDYRAYADAAARLVESGSLYQAETLDGPYRPGPYGLYMYAPPLGLVVAPLAVLAQEPAVALWFLIHVLTLVLACVLMPVRPGSVWPPSAWPRSAWPSRATSCSAMSACCCCCRWWQRGAGLTSPSGRRHKPWPCQYDRCSA